MNISKSSNKHFIGLLELDPTGTVLYSRREGEDGLGFAPPDVAGSNFFTEVADFVNVEDFRRRLDSFMRSHVPTDRFEFTCDFTDGALPVRVLLARIRECADNVQTKSILVHIKKA